MIKFIKDLESYAEQWVRLQESSPSFSFFQTKECYDFYKSLSFMNAFAYGVVKDDELCGVIVGYVTKDCNPLKQFLTRRAVINAGPMLSADISDEALETLLVGMKNQLKKKAIYIETRNFFDYSKYQSVFEKAGFDYVKHLNFKVDTSSLEVVNTNLSKSIKRDVRITLRDGASVVEKPTKEQIGQYYLLLADLYKTKVKTPLFPEEFFLKLAELPSALILLVSFNDKIMGGTICVGSNGRMYEWFACGDDRLVKHVFPSKLATYSSITYCAENDFSVFDMMGAGKPDESYGVRDFKAMFGGELVQEGRFQHIANPLLYKIGTLGVKILKRK